MEINGFLSNLCIKIFQVPRINLNLKFKIKIIYKFKKKNLDLITILMINVNSKLCGIKINR